MELRGRLLNIQAHGEMPIKLDTAADLKSYSRMDGQGVVAES